MKTFTHKSTTLNSIIIVITLLTLFLTGISITGHCQIKGHGVNVGLIYPLSTNGTGAYKNSNFLSLHGLAGVSREENAFTVSGFTNVIKENAQGFQVAGFSNHIGGNSRGFLASGFINTYDSARGFQSAGFANLAHGNITGMQASGFINTSGDIHGFQAAGFVNISEDVNGGQAAGFINIAKKVKGAQLSGFINIADSSDYPIGIINIIKNGERSIGISTDDNLTTLLSFRSGGRKLYGIIGVGSNLKNSKEVFSLQYGIGAHLISKDKFRVNSEVTTVMLENFKHGEFKKFSISLMPAIKLAPNLEVFGGPALNFINTNTDEGKNLIKHYVWDDTNKQNHLNGIYVGYTAGVHWIL